MFCIKYLLFITINITCLKRLINYELSSLVNKVFMLKSIFFVIFLFCSFQGVFCQQTISTAGGNGTNEKGTVSFTIGQLVYNSYSNENGSLFEGVQQNLELFALTNLELTALTLKAVTYPNPASDYVILALKNAQLTGLSYLLYDLLGKQVASGKVTQENTQITMKKFSIGTYLLKVVQNNKELKVFKIIKFK